MSLTVSKVGVSFDEASASAFQSLANTQFYTVCMCVLNLQPLSILRIWTSCGWRRQRVSQPNSSSKQPCQNRILWRRATVMRALLTMPETALMMQPLQVKFMSPTCYPRVSWPPEFAPDTHLLPTFNPTNHFSFPFLPTSLTICPCLSPSSPAFLLFTTPSSSPVCPSSYPPVHYRLLVPLLAPLLPSCLPAPLLAPWPPAHYSLPVPLTTTLMPTALYLCTPLLEPCSSSPAYVFDTRTLYGPTPTCP